MNTLVRHILIGMLHAFVSAFTDRIRHGKTSPPAASDGPEVEVDGPEIEVEFKDDEEPLRAALGKLRARCEKLEHELGGARVRDLFPPA